MSPTDSRPSISFRGDETFAILGAGRVGISLGLLLRRAGHKIVGCSARSAASLERAVKYLECPSSTSYAEVVSDADCVIIAVPDDQVPAVAGAVRDHLPPGTFVLHTAGSMGLDPLVPLRGAGARVLAVHLLQSVPNVEVGVERIPGSWFGVTCPEELKGWAESLVATLGGKVRWVSEEDRNIYHAAAVIASNYLVALGALIEEAGLEAEPYLPLMEGTLRNLSELGPARALTGPVARGDIGTVQRHLRELDSEAPEVGSAYRVLAEVALRLAEKSELIEGETAQEMRQVLRREER